jgi:aminopeptidase YwaD
MPDPSTAASHPRTMDLENVQPLRTTPMRERAWTFSLHLIVLISCLWTALAAEAGSVSATSQAPNASRNRRVCASCIRAHMEFLASDALRGRGSGTPDELLAATYVASQLRQYGIQPAGDNGTFLQRAVIHQQKFAAPPQLRFTPSAGTRELVWTHGAEMLAVQVSQGQFQGPLKRLDTLTPPTGAPDLKGAVVVVVGSDESKVQAAVQTALEGGATAVLAPASARRMQHWDERAHELPALPPAIEGGGPGVLGGEGNVVALRPEAAAQVRELAEGTLVEFDGTLSPSETSHTWNAVGKLPGRNPALRMSAILLTAHLDHIGVGKPVDGDSIYNGADDDASGVTAVLELARALASRGKPQRTVIFALFGSEESAGLGSAWFEVHPPVPLASIAANLEFEMIGRPDPTCPRDALWLTGWERSNLGPMLAAHGARLVPDRRPEEHFFARSDNYVLAKKGVVAQTASSFGLHADYHQPSDDLAHIDFRHMTAAIGSLIAPIEWLANSEFRPAWRKGQEP